MRFRTGIGASVMPLNVNAVFVKCRAALILHKSCINKYDTANISINICGTAESCTNHIGTTNGVISTSHIINCFKYLW